MDTKAECDRLNLAYVAEKNIKKKLKQTNTSGSVQVQDLWWQSSRNQKDYGVWTKGLVKESGVKGRESDRQLQLCHS